MTSALFTPIAIGDLTLANRIVISPMCQYSACEGSAGTWHLFHLARLAHSGAGLLIMEATAVARDGRITHGCLGLFSDDNESALSAVVSAMRQHSPIPIGIQLSHAGRKASARPPFDGSGPLQADGGSWQTVGPSAVPVGPDWPAPVALDPPGMTAVVADFVAAAERADRIGFDLLELHAAHGYLLSSFLSPLANQRTDCYGGTLANRMRFPLEVFEAVRAVWPACKPLGVRINGTDWDPAGITPNEAATFAVALKDRGCDFVDVSSGGNAPVPPLSTPGYQVPFAAQVRRAAGITTIAVGLIRQPRQAEAVVASGEADLIAVGRAILNNPHWPWLAAEELGGSIAVPRQYARASHRR